MADISTKRSETSTTPNYRDTRRETTKAETMTPQGTHASGGNDAESTINAWEILDKMVEASLCGICWKLLDRMYTATCGHSYCMKCAEELLSGETRNLQIQAGLGKCPTCKERISSPTRLSGGVIKPALKHSVMIRHNFEQLRTWAIWRKGQDDRARAAGESIGETRCNWRLHGWEINVADVPDENVGEDDDDDDDVDADVDGIGEDDSDDATQAFSQESFEERRRQMQRRSRSPPSENPLASLARHNRAITRAPAVVHTTVASGSLFLHSTRQLEAHFLTGRRQGDERTGGLSRGNSAPPTGGDARNID
ncbi:hypothetical protein CkaCkLH20_01574 [Colletotrichum karsti]|uniref:RING-type domain-containing protein n=1 Tax=Colletotrichum karsti TaxID=1095194 RepID=A0A9P6LQB3_9PEZI|nr:uncharacterized protein CkaCkLH20_01574 [Colletotrichum karsti]KAF9880532.1 hypothetical protein CkaCkLH20_01574 [Colletotrichum karsti]